MSTVSDHDPRWNALLKPEWMQSLDDTRFIWKCRRGVASRAELHQFVRQHHHYSKDFTRYLCALLSNISDEHDRAALTRNLFDEMGMSGGASHAEIYRRMMQAMLPNSDGGAVLPATLALVDTMFDCCRNPRAMVGLGALCLGAEAIVPRLYAAILNGFDAAQEPAQNLEFFRIHITADDEHALTMHAIILRELARDPCSRLDLEYGAARAIAARVSFFEALCDNGTEDSCATARKISVALAPSWTSSSPTNWCIATSRAATGTNGSAPSAGTRSSSSICPHAR